MNFHITTPEPRLTVRERRARGTGGEAPVAKTYEDVDVVVFHHHNHKANLSRGDIVTREGREGRWEVVGTLLEVVILRRVEELQ